MPTATEVAEFGVHAEAAAVLEDVLVEAHLKNITTDYSAIGWAVERARQAGETSSSIGEQRRQSGRTLKLLGRVLVAMNGDTPDALAAFTAALEQDPTDRESAIEKQLLGARLAEVANRLRQIEELRKANAAK